MAPTFHKLHRHFVGESSSIELRNTFDPDTLAVIRAGMDECAILVFRDQVFSNAEQLAFGERLDGRLHQGTGSRAFTKSRLGDETIAGATTRWAIASGTPTPRSSIRPGGTRCSTRGSCHLCRPTRSTPTCAPR